MIRNNASDASDHIFIPPSWHCQISFIKLQKAKFKFSKKKNSIDFKDVLTQLLAKDGCCLLLGETLKNCGLSNISITHVALLELWNLVLARDLGAKAEISLILPKWW